MNMFFTKVGQQLYDIIGNSENNTVAHAYNQVFTQGFAEGGIVGDESTTRLTDTDPLGVNSMIRTGSKAITKGLSSASANYDKTFREQMTMGHFIHNNFGTFFKGADTGGTNEKMKMPTPNKGPLPATDPEEFYAKWYMGLRRFAEAGEVATRGQAQVRSR
jgi:hypothetical protein